MCLLCFISEFKVCCLRYKISGKLSIQQGLLLQVENKYVMEIAV